MGKPNKNPPANRASQQPKLALSILKNPKKKKKNQILCLTTKQNDDQKNKK